MIIPIRCWSCGKPIAQCWEEFEERSKKGESKKDVLDDLGVERYCCSAEEEVIVYTQIGLPQEGLNELLALVKEAFEASSSGFLKIVLGTGDSCSGGIYLL